MVLLIPATTADLEPLGSGHPRTSSGGAEALLEMDGALTRALASGGPLTLVSRRPPGCRIVLQHRPELTGVCITEPGSTGEVALLSVA